MLIFLIGIALCIYCLYQYIRRKELKTSQLVIALALILLSLIIPSPMQEEKAWKEFELSPLFYSEKESKNIYVTQNKKDIWEYKIKKYSIDGKLSKDTRLVSRMVEIVKGDFDTAKVQIFKTKTSMTWYSMGAKSYERYCFYIPE